MEAGGWTGASSRYTDLTCCRRRRSGSPATTTSTSSSTVESASAGDPSAPSPKNRARTTAGGIPSTSTCARRGSSSSPGRADLPEEGLADVEPRLRRERERFDVDALVVAVEAPGHHLRREGPREQTEAVGDGATLAEVRRAGESVDHAGQQTRPRAMRADDPAERVP